MESGESRVNNFQKLLERAGRKQEECRLDSFLSASDEEVRESIARSFALRLRHETPFLCVSTSGERERESASSFSTAHDETARWCADC